MEQILRVAMVINGAPLLTFVNHLQDSLLHPPPKFRTRSGNIDNDKVRDMILFFTLLYRFVSVCVTLVCNVKRLISYVHLSNSEETEQ